MIFFIEAHGFSVLALILSEHREREQQSEGGGVERRKKRIHRAHTRTHIQRERKKSIQIKTEETGKKVPRISGWQIIAISELFRSFFFHRFPVRTEENWEKGNA